MRAPSSRLEAYGARRIGGTAVLTLGTLAPAFGALLLGAGLAGGRAEAKTPGKTYCFYGTCHRVKTIAETEALVGSEETLSASHYDSCKRDRYNPCGLTSSGAVFDADAPDNAASPIYPDGTTLLVWSPETQVSLVVRVNNAGPYWGRRKLDLSRGAAELLGFAHKGVAELRVRVIDAPSVEEATYKARRSYDPVPGYIGRFASLDEAETAAATAYMVAGLPSPFAPAGLGAGNPTQVAGAAGTQSGAATVVPAGLVASAPAPAVVAASAAPSEALRPASGSVAALAPVKAAAQVRMTEVIEVADASAVAPAVARRGETAALRSRNGAERAAQRNSRAYRVAARQQRKAVRARPPVEMAEAAAPPRRERVITQDGTNDMSMFSRHTYAGVERLASQEPPRRRAAFSSLGGRDDEG